jgi:prophage maintenance system killer protein
MSKCLRCNHEWKTRKESPRFCPNCNSPYWNKERKKPSKQEIESMIRLIKQSHEGAMEIKEDRGVRDEGGIYNASYNIISYESNFPNDISGITIIIINEIAKKGHFFIDGNKRTAFITAKAHLLTKGYKLEIPKISPTDIFIRELVSHNSKISFKSAKTWIKKYINKNSKNLKDYIIDIILNK